MPYVGTRDPEALDIKITAPDAFDLSTVTSIEMSVRSPTKITLPWEWTIGVKTATELHAVHLFAADGKDAKEEGEYTVSGWLVSVTTRRRIKPVKVRFERYG